MSKISLKHTSGKVVSLNSPTAEPGANDVAFKLPNADGSDGQAIVTDGSGNLSFGSVAATRRLNINGEFQVFQRSTSAAVDTSSTYVAPDRYRFSVVGSQRFTASQSTDVPAGYGFQNSLKLDCTTASGTVAANGEAVLEHRMEGQDLQVFCKGTAQAKQYAFSFHVKSPKTGVHWVEFYDDDNNRHCCKSYTISTANQWQKVTLTYSGDTSGAFVNDNATSLRIFFWLLAGSSYTSGGTPSATWTAFDGDARATGQVNVFDSTDNDFYITGVQLEVGSVATDFEHRSFAQELSLCQRYFYMHASGGFDLVNTDRCPIGLGYGYTSTDGFVLITFPTQMRTDPTLYKVVGTDYFNFAYNGTNGYPNDISVNRMSSQVAEVSFHTGSSWDQNAAGMFRTYNSAARVGFVAEL